jgi:cytochrome oxidase assembly protein ShyY1
VAIDTVGTSDSDGTVSGRMYRFLLTPRWIGFHLLVILAIVTMINLGFWQLRRLDQKRERADTIAARIDVPPVPLDALVPADLSAGDEAPTDAEWRSVTAAGTYLPDDQFLVVNRSQDGLAGDMVVTPLQLDDRRVLLVERGFVPAGAEDEETPAPDGHVEVVGRLRQSQRHSPGQLTNAAEGVITEAQQFDIPRLAEQMPGAVVPMYIELTSSTPAEAGPYPVPVNPPVRDLGPHLSYAIQWFIFSVCAAVGWVLAVRRSLATRRRAAT